ncbi:hypothetical protein GUJ93_ZPchr0012g19067 [Zizania palustris]|uniref:Uncharacterized protein n=1 Tax=Zizania palustris TaxID=103762 RepID=A0A8J6BSY4_ZIZPA|nr:hypothetical protein GUJ93_ZPchr0012g19067 [Zizania palustris]
MPQHSHLAATTSAAGWIEQLLGARRGRQCRFLHHRGPLGAYVVELVGDVGHGVRNWSASRRAVALQSWELLSFDCHGRRDCRYYARKICYFDILNMYILFMMILLNLTQIMNGHK